MGQLGPIFGIVGQGKDVLRVAGSRKTEEAHVSEGLVSSPGLQQHHRPGLMSRIPCLRALEPGALGGSVAELVSSPWLVPSVSTLHEYSGHTGSGPSP